MVLKGSASQATRNLALGVTLALAAIPLGAVAFWCAPKESFVALTTSVVVGLLLFLSLQFRLLLQRNGVFLLLSGGLALVLLVPIGVRLIATGSELAETFAAFRRAQIFGSAGGQGSPQAPAQAMAPAATTPAAPASGANAGGLSRSGGQASDLATSVAVDVEPSSKLEKKEMTASATPQEGRGGLDKAFPDEDSVARQTRLAKDEAIRRYPALQSSGTKEHAVYLEAFNELSRNRKFEFFKDPQWPLKIAEMLAVREGWKRAENKPGLASSNSKKAPLPGSEFSLSGGALANLRPEQDSQSAVPVEPASPNATSTVTSNATSDAPVASGSSSGTLDPAEDAVNKSMKEAKRRYPAIGAEGSAENKAFLEAYQDMDGRRTDFFEKSDWPIRLVELVAKQEGWKRVDAASAEK